MQLLEIFGYLGALLTLATFSMKTMIHLRMVGIVANVAFMTYGAMGEVYPVLLLHMTLLPLNVLRLRQLLRLTRQIEAATTQAFDVAWLKPFSHSRDAAAGETLFRRGDAAQDMLFVLDGQFRALEAGVVLSRGDVLGELGLISRDRRRTQTVVCEQAGTLLVIRYDEALQMYFQNPRFGFYFLQLAAERLARDANRAAAQVEVVASTPSSMPTPPATSSPSPG